MIKAIELRKGVLIIDYTGIVREVYGEDIQQQCWYEEGQTGTTEAQINPIPLSSEWLERCGFVYKDGATECGEERKNGVHLYVHDEDPGYFHFSRGSFNGTKVEIKYLHQLQNLYFALTGEELNVKL